MKDGGNAAAAISSYQDDELDDLDLDDEELPDVSSTPKLKDFLPFMSKGASGKESLTQQLVCAYWEIRGIPGKP